MAEGCKHGGRLGNGILGWRSTFGLLSVVSEFKIRHYNRLGCAALHPSINTLREDPLTR